MQPVGNERPGAPSYAARPGFQFGAPLQAAAPPRPTAAAPNIEAPSFGAPSPRFTVPPSIAPPSMVAPPTAYPSSMGQSQPFPASQYPPMITQYPPMSKPAAIPGGPIPGGVQPPPPTFMGQSPLVARFPAQTAMPPQPQVPLVPMGPLPAGANFVPSRGISSPPSSLDPSVPTSRPTFQPPMSGYSVGVQPGVVPPPPMVGAPVQSVRGPMQHPIVGPPTTLQGLVEDFQSLSVSSVPGSMDAGIDSQSLPRPLGGDVEPSSSGGMFPYNCHPRFFRLTTSVLPNSQSLLSRWHLPLGAVVHPLAEPPNGEEVPIINFGPAGIVRCRRCRTYVNPYVTFTDSGRKWRCNICALFNDVPGEYFSYLDASGRRADLDQRPELTMGSVEFVAPTEYMVRAPMPPTYFFLIDVSLSAVRNGMLEIAAKTIKSCLNDLPGFPRTQVGFITFDSTIHFYNMKSSLSQPQLLVVADLDDVFVPLPDDLLVNLSESRTVVETFLDSLPSMFQDSTNVESAFGPALKASLMVMSQLGGKLLVFQSTLPSLGIGRLKLRGDDMRIYGTDKEHTVRIPEDPFYKQMAADLTKYQIGVNVYAFSEKYSDLASLGTLAKYTGGQVFYYPFFQANIHGEKFSHDLKRDLTRETAWEAVMRIRCGKGVRFTSYHGHFMLRTADLMALPAVDCDKAFAMQLSLEETLLTSQTVYFQLALLYTSSSGERRIRVHTAAVPVVTDLGEMYRQADTGAVVSLLGRLAIEKTLSSKLEEARQFIQLKIVKALKEYRNLYAVQHRLTGRLIFPESLKFLPLFALALCKSIPLRGGYNDAHLDERCALGFSIMTRPIRRVSKLLYPTLVRIDEYLMKGSPNADDTTRALRPLPLTIESLDPSGLFLYDDGYRFILWFGKGLSSNFISSLLGSELMGLADLSKARLTEQNNDISKRLTMLLKRIRESDPSSYQHCILVRQGEQPRESALLLLNLVEDQMGGTSGYVDWVLQTHRQVQQGP